MHASPEILRYGAYICVRVPDEARPAVAAAAVPQLVDRHGLRNEFDADGGHPDHAVAFLRRIGAIPKDIEDNELLCADAVIHAASPDPAIVAQFAADIGRLLSPETPLSVLSGVIRPPKFTGAAMHEFAYAHQVLQQPGRAMPNGFLVPMCKTREWWTKHWMERHTYFLPRYGEDGRMLNQGHALAAAAGIPCLMRRTYRNSTEPAADGSYDFVNYFECADADVPVFHAVCAALRDVGKNPEWRFVREGPTWHGRRVRTWRELFG